MRQYHNSKYQNCVPPYQHPPNHHFTGLAVFSNVFGLKVLEPASKKETRKACLAMRKRKKIEKGRKGRSIRRESSEEKSDWVAHFYTNQIYFLHSIVLEVFQSLFSKVSNS